MGVNIYLLDRRTVVLKVGNRRNTIGTLRRFNKATELDVDRAAEIEEAKWRTPSPIAAMLADVTDTQNAAGLAVSAHLVLGWDADRSTVTDWTWEHLPQLGYAVRDPNSRDYVLHQMIDGKLHPVDAARARELGLTDDTGAMVRHGQPKIIECQKVRHFVPRYAEAECRLDNGATQKLLTVTDRDELPPVDWFVGKRPMDVQTYAGTR